MPISHSDIPLTDPKDDLFDRSEYAENISKALVGLSRENSYMIGINGSWGEGKTTFINFICHYLNRNSSVLKIWFNPWCFSNRNDIIQQYFDSLTIRLSKSEKKWNETKKGIIKLAHMFQSTELPFSKIPAAIADELLSPSQTLLDLKEEINRSLKKQKDRIIIIIDDLDRLDSEEIYHLFSFLKAVADFSSIIYILSFDYEIVRKALKKHGGGSFLEKIINLHFNLPLLTEEQISTVLSNGLKEYINQTSNQLRLVEDLPLIYREGLRYLIKTPREAKRLINNFGLNYLILLNQVNLVDFLLIEFVRIKYPVIHKIIKGNPDHFAFTINSAFNEQIRQSTGKNQVSDSIDKINVLVPDEFERLTLYEVLSYMFPKIRPIISNRPLINHRAYNKTNRRIYEEDFFHLYFKYTSSDDLLSLIDIEKIKHSFKTERSFYLKIKTLLSKHSPVGITLFKKLMNDFEQYFPIDALSYKEHKVIIIVLIKYYNVLIVDEDEKRDLLFDIGSDTLIKRLVLQILNIVEYSDRMTILIELIKKCEDVSGIVLLLNDKETILKNGVFREEDYNYLVKQLIAKIMQKAENGQLVGEKSLFRIIEFWKSYGENKDIVEWILNLIDTEQKLAEFVENIMIRFYINTSISYKIHINAFGFLAEPQLSRLYHKITQLQKDASNFNLTKRQVLALSVFIDSYKEFIGNRDK